MMESGSADDDRSSHTEPKRGAEAMSHDVERS
jgi:hypothetical protein